LSHAGMTPGFTLIEILLAVALSALLLTAVYGTYFSINKSIDAALEDQEALDTGRTFSELLKKDIRGISPVRFSLKGKNEEIEGHSFGQIEFVTTAGIDKDAFRLRRVGYALVPRGKGEKALVRRESRNLNDPLDDSAKVFEISRIINGFHVEFFNGTEWTESWDSTATGGMPKQIRWATDVTDAKGNDRRFTAEEGIQSTSQ